MKEGLQQVYGEHRDFEPEVGQAAVTIFEYLRIEDTASYADALYILGGATLGPAHRAAQLYQEGYAGKIVCVSRGGTFAARDTFGGILPEASRYRTHLLGQGIRPDDLWMADETANTLVEAQRAIPFMREHGLSPGTVLLCSRPFHQRRAWGTFRKQHPDIDYLNFPATDEGLIPNAVDHLQRLVGEIEREQGYAKKGDIDLPQTPLEIHDATAVVRNALRARDLYTPWILR